MAAAAGGFVYPGGGRAQSNKLTRQQIDGANLAERERLASPPLPKKVKETPKCERRLLPSSVVGPVSDAASCSVPPPVRPSPAGGFFSSLFGGGSSKKSIKSDSSSLSSSRRPSLQSFQSEPVPPPPPPFVRAPSLMSPPSAAHALPSAKPQLVQKTSIQPLSDEQMRDLTNRLAHAPNDLSEQDTFVLVDHYEEAGLCFPQNPEWIANVTLLVETFYEAAPHLKVSPSTRKRTAEFLYEGVYARAKDDAAASRALVGEVILPLLERTLGKETEPEIDDQAIAVLVDVAVAETLRLEQTGKALRSDPDGKAQETTVPVKHSGADPPTPVSGMSLGAEDPAEDRLFASEEANAAPSFFSAIKTLLIKSATWSAATSNRQCVRSRTRALPLDQLRG